MPLVKLTLRCSDIQEHIQNNTCLSEEVQHDDVTTAHGLWNSIKNTESAQNWLRVSFCTQHYSLVGHRLPNLSSWMVVGKIDLRVNYTLGAFAAMSGM